MRSYRTVTLLCGLGLLLCGCQSAPKPPEGVRLYPGFGNYQRDVTANSAQAKIWFNQGIQLLYGFNHDEAIRSFERAVEIDPNCAMAWWGIAYANGLHINNPQMTEAQSLAGWQASQEALTRLRYASPVEQALIKAVAMRYAWPAPEDRRALDEAYAEEMERVWLEFPDDADVGALYAESLMNLQPWDLWTLDGVPKGRTLEIVRVLEETLESDPDHPGANHFYIHTVEASNTPERGLESARRLERLVPGSGHLVHMPSHIYGRLGMWEEASNANRRAIAADDGYFEMAPAPAFYGLYYAHNVHFLAYASMMEGRSRIALEAADDLMRDIPPVFLQEYVEMADSFTTTRFHVLIRFGMWNEILDEPEAPVERKYSRAIRHYARGVALSALSRTDEARAELALFEAACLTMDDSWAVGNNSAEDVLAVARAMLKGEILYRDAQYEEAFTLLRRGVVLEDQLRYDEPPGWMQPVRHALGATLMSVGEAEEAEAVYRADLAKNPRNGWALLGLERAVGAQGRTAEAAELAEQRSRMWRRADVRPTSSCYCAPLAWEGAGEE